MAWGRTEEGGYVAAPRDPTAFAGEWEAIITLPGQKPMTRLVTIEERDEHGYILRLAAGAEKGYRVILPRQYVVLSTPGTFRVAEKVNGQAG